MHSVIFDTLYPHHIGRRSFIAHMPRLGETGQQFRRSSQRPATAFVSTPLTMVTQGALAGSLAGAARASVLAGHSHMASTSAVVPATVAASAASSNGAGNVAMTQIMHTVRRTGFNGAWSILKGEASGIALPLAVYASVYGIVKYTLRLDHHEEFDSPIEYASIGALASVAARWPWPASVATALQVGTYEYIKQDEARQQGIEGR